MVVDPGKFRHCQPPRPVRHRAKIPFRPTVVTNPALRTSLQKIQRLDRSLDAFILRASDYAELVVDAWASNFHASTALEGNPLRLAEVRETTRRAAEGTLDEELDPHRQEIIQHVVSWAAGDAFAGPWSVSMVQGLHHTLSVHLGEHYQPGILRTDPDRIAVGGDEVAPSFEGAPGTNVEREMDALLTWLNTEAPVMDPLVAAALFFHEFESIHPFEDGNGRVGRMLFHLYMQNNGLPNSHKCMIEEPLTRDADLYYRILAWTDHKDSYTELIDFFVDATLEAYEQAITRFEERDLLTTGVEENRKQLLIRAHEHGGWFPLREASQWVQARSDMTVRKYLEHWIAQGAIEEKGRTSSKRYRFIHPMRQLTELAEPTAAGQPRSDV